MSVYTSEADRERPGLGTRYWEYVYIGPGTSEVSWTGTVLPTLQALITTAIASGLDSDWFVVMRHPYAQGDARLQAHLARAISRYKCGQDPDSDLWPA